MEDKITQIYLVTNCYGDLNKVYIGKTSRSRESAHKRTFGKNVKYDYIDSINSLDIKDWKPLETYWIHQFIAWGFEVMNVRKDGGSGPSFYTEEQKQKMRKPKPTSGNRGNKSLETLVKMRKPRKEGTGDKISKANKGKSQPLSFFKKVRGKSKSKEWIENKFKPIKQLDLEGNFIKEWPSLQSASKLLGGDINACLKGKQKTSSGFKWEYKND